MVERAIDHKSEFVDVSVHDNHVMMRAGSVTVYSRLVEGRFPRYRDVIPRKSTHVIPIAVGPFFGSVRQASIVTDEENRGVDFVFDDGSLVIRSRANVGDSSVELPIEFDGDKLTITFDPKYVSDFLKVCRAEMLVDLHLTDALLIPTPQSLQNLFGNLVSLATHTRNYVIFNNLRYLSHFYHSMRSLLPQKRTVD
jgi:DNA polymerase-3 subunit beta